MGLELTLPGGEHISTLKYTLFDATLGPTNAATTYAGTYSVGEAGIISFVIGSVAAGSNYVLTLSADTDETPPRDTCSYPQAGVSPTTETRITVANRMTTIVDANMQCVNNQGLDSGSVLVNTLQSNCPTWNTIVANPENIVIPPPGSNVNDSGTPGSTAIFPGSAPVTALVGAGQKAVIVGSATGPNQGALAFAWTVNGTGATVLPAAGVLDSNGTGQPNGQSATNQTIFTCPATGTGTYTVTLTLSDGPLPEGGSCDPAFTTGSVTISCVPVNTCGAFGTGCGDGGQICNAAGSCVPALFSVVVLNGYPDGSTIDTHGVQLPITIQNYSLTGPQGAPIALPTGTDSRPAITLPGDNITEGDLTTSSDGRYLSVLGWNASAGGSAQNVSVVVARVDSSRNVDTSTLSPSAFHDGTMATALRSCASLDGTGFWCSGENGSQFVDGGANSAGGIYYLPFGSAAATLSTQLVAFPSYDTSIDPFYGVSARWLRLFGGQLYASTDLGGASASPGQPPYMINIGGPGAAPTSGSPAVNLLPGGFETWSGPTPSPYGFVMFDTSPPAGPDVMYIADDGVNPLNTAETSGVDTNAGGLYKWTFDGTNWNQVATWKITGGVFGPGSGSVQGKNIGFRGIAGFATGTLVTLMATTGNITGAPDSLVLVMQEQVSSTTAPTTGITTFPATPLYQVLRGVALTPQ